MTLMEKYDVKGEDCLFIDDREDNVVAARDLGMQAIRFEDYEQVREELELLLENQA